MALCDEKSVYFLDFSDAPQKDIKIKRLCQKRTMTVVLGETPSSIQLTKELQGYFSGATQTFLTPLSLTGTPFQEKVWQELQRTSYGTTRSYGAQAAAMLHPSACRAVANANGANLLSIIIPCHRICQQTGDLGGYAGGRARKKWLLDHEKKHAL